MASRRILRKPCFNVFSVPTANRPFTNHNGRTVTTLAKASSIHCSSFSVQRRATTWTPSVIISGHGPAVRHLVSMTGDGVRKGTGTATKTGLGETQQTETSTRTDNKVVDVLTLLYDGECPLCMKEVNMLRRRSDARGGTLGFIDIAELDFEEMGVGVDYETAMGKIHAVRPDGSLVVGVQVFRDAYEAVGLGWVYSVLRIPGAPWLAERVYDVWADKRLQLTGRDTLEAIVRSRNEKRSCK